MKKTFPQWSVHQGMISLSFREGDRRLYGPVNRVKAWEAIREHLPPKVAVKLIKAIRRQLDD